ncbi:MAG: hypothetical protein LAT68_17200 [Cyclobacteriaceae bacterium]|nr:hypothetical protein [Cyclobacteriaceae bacterium]
MSNIILRSLLAFPPNPPAGTAKVFVEDGRFQVIDEDGNSLLPAGGDADQVAYDPTASGLDANDVQSAIDEIVAGGGGGGGITPEQAEQLATAFKASGGHVVIEVVNESPTALSPGDFVTDYRLNPTLFTEVGFIKNHTPDGDNFSPDPDPTVKPDAVIRVVPVSTLIDSVQSGMEPWDNFGVLGTLGAIPRVLRMLESVAPGEAGKALLRGWAFTDNDEAPGLGAPFPSGNAYINSSGELATGIPFFDPSVVDRWAGELVASPFLFVYTDTTPTPTLPITFTFPNAPLRDDALSSLGPIAGALSGKDGLGVPEQFFIMSSGDIINEETNAVIGSCNFSTGEITITTDFQLLDTPDGRGYINVVAVPMDTSLRSLVYFDGERGEFMPQALFRAEPENIPDTSTAYFPYFNVSSGKWSWQQAVNLPPPIISTDTTLSGVGSFADPLGVAPASLGPDKFSNGTQVGQSFVWNGFQWDLGTSGYPWSVGPGQPYTSILDAETAMDAASVYMPILLYPGLYEVYNGLSKPLIGISGSLGDVASTNAKIVFNSASIESPYVENVVFDDQATFFNIIGVSLKDIRTSTPIPLQIVDLGAAADVTLENCTGFGSVQVFANNQKVKIRSCEMEALTLGAPTDPVIAEIKDTTVFDPNTLFGGQVLVSGALEASNFFFGKLDFTANYVAGVAGIRDTLYLRNGRILAPGDDPIEIKGAIGIPPGGYTFRILDTRITLGTGNGRLSVNIPSGPGIAEMGIFEMSGCETNLRVVDFESTGGDSGGGTVYVINSSFAPAGTNTVFRKTNPAVSVVLYWNVQYDPASYISEEGGSPTAVNGFSDDFLTVNPLRTSIP